MGNLLACCTNPDQDHFDRWRNAFLTQDEKKKKADHHKILSSRRSDDLIPSAFAPRNLSVVRRNTPASTTSSSLRQDSTTGSE